jgi:membrane-bound lytic murein transglycosylase D
MEERIPMRGSVDSPARRRAAVVAHARLAARWLVAGTAALVLAGCATVGGGSADGGWPMVPSKRSAAAGAATTAGGAAVRRAGDVGAGRLPAPVVEDPNPPEQVGGADYEDLFDRIRAGYRLPEVEHPRIDQQLRFYTARPEYLDRVFERAERYLYYIVGELEARGMPLELAMLPVVESAYNPYAYSRARAAGLWQFIPPTAALYQVRVNWWQDGRRDVVDSTRAALDYLEKLNAQFGGDWWLSLAAYNCGEGCVSRAIERNRAAGLPTDYWSLRLPEETRNYVPKLIAMARVVGEPEAFELGFAPIANVPYFQRVEVGSQIDLRLAARLAGVTEDELHALNPAFNRWATDPDGPHHLLVPFTTAPQFADAIARLSAEQRMPLERHVVRPGDAVTSLAKARDVPAAAIKRLNGLTSTKLTVGDEIVLPASSIAPLRANLVIEGESPASLAAAQSKKRARVYVVKRGDTLWSIAKKNDMGVRELATLNGLSPQATLPAGKRLKVSSGGTRVASTSGAEDGTRKAGTRTAKSADSARRVSYVVRSGDTLHRISRQFAVSVAQLKEWNRLSDAAIRPGQRIVVLIDGRRDVGG